MDEIKKAFDPKERNSAEMKAFGFRLRNQFSTNEAYRRPKELQWLEDLRQYKGIYDPDVKIAKNNSKVYPKITRSKVNIVLSRLHEMLFPETERNWEILPMDEPKIAPEIVKMLITKEIQKKMIGIQEPQPQSHPTMQPGGQTSGTAQIKQPPLPTVAEVKLAIKKYAEDCCDTMTMVIDDQLCEMDYPEETKKVLRSGLTFGTGIMKGPMINHRTKHTWAPAKNGDFEETKQAEEVPYFEAIRIWDWYPDMTVTDIESIEGSFERHLMTKHDLRQLLNREDYIPEMILEYLEAHPSGDYVPKNWEVDLQTIEVMAGAGKTNYTMTMGATNSNDTNRTTNRQIGKKYEVLEYWGYVDGSDLQACGLDIPDVSLEYACNVFLLGQFPIKAVLFDGALDQYKLFYYEKDETSLFGEGLPRVMRHSQIAIAAAARMVLDNGACVSGPQVEVNWSLMTPDTDLDSFYPRKIWYREGRGVEAQYPALRALNFDSHIPELLSIVKAFEDFGDQETTLPTWLISEQVNNETAQKTSSRNANITISIKDIVKNFDIFTEHVIRAIYNWNMEFNPRTDIKGDYNIKARGVSSLVMKEIRMQALNQLSQTMTPEDWVYVDRREFLKEKFKAHDLNIRLRTEEEAEKIRKQIQDSVQNQLNLKLLQADVDYKRAQTMGQLAKAKKHNVDATKEAATAPEQPEIKPENDPRIADAELQKKNAEINDTTTKTALAVDKHEHDKSLNALDKHVEIAKGLDEHAQNMAIKNKVAEHGMKLREKTARAKPATKPKKSGGINK